MARAACPCPMSRTRASRPCYKAMSDKTESNPTFTTENQRQRWIKYGGNVLLTAVIVIVLALVLIAISQRQHKRFDTTQNKEYSLKPQTINIIKDLNQPVKLVSLYSHAQTNSESDTDYAGAVADLLDEYKRSGRNIDVETIDPVTSPTKVDDLIAEVTNKYGGEVKKYRDFCDSAPTYFEPVRNFAKTEMPKISALPIDQMKQDELTQAFNDISTTVSGLSGQLDKVIKLIDTQRKQKVPDYKGAAETINSTMQQVSDYADQIGTNFNKFKTDPGIPAPFKAYMEEASPRFADLKKQADAVLAEYKKLGELKLDDVRQKLRERDAILVMGPNDMRSLSFDQVWQADVDKRAYQNQSGDIKIKPKFAGEQRITSAILSLTAAKKPKVVFLRPSGPPLTTPGFPPFQQGGPMSKIADRLRDYNFDVLEKDLSGQYAAQSQEAPAAPEPTDEEIKDAVWVYIGFPNNPQQQTPPVPFGPKLAEHLNGGGAALCLLFPQADNLAEGLKDWGVTARTDLLIVHEPVHTSSTSTDFIEEAKKNSLVFITNQYGDHLITQPLRSLDSVLIPLSPVSITATPGYQATPIIPVTSTSQVWGEHNIESALNNEQVTFKPDEGDVAGPFNAGAVVQSDKGGRLVVIGSLQFITNQMLNVRDQELAQRGVVAARFPANAELFCNSVFWLAHMEPLIAISPSAMEVNRIGEISDNSLRAWRIGLLLVGLPGAVVLCGMLVYFARRD